MNLSPGILGTYWLAASVAAATLWTLAARAVKAYGCPCGCTR